MSIAAINSVGHGIACFDTSKYRTRSALHPLVIDIDTERKVQQVYNKYTSTHDECTASVSSQSGLLSARFPAIYLLGYFVPGSTTAIRVLSCTRNTALPGIVYVYTSIVYSTGAGYTNSETGV